MAAKTKNKDGRKEKGKGKGKGKGNLPVSTSTAFHRGDLKISNPIPIKGEDDGDDDFPLRRSTKVFSVVDLPRPQTRVADTGCLSPVSTDIGQAVSTVDERIFSPLDASKPLDTDLDLRASIIKTAGPPSDDPLITSRPSKADARNSQIQARPLSQMPKRGKSIKSAFNRLFRSKSQKDIRPQSLAEQPPIPSVPSGRASLKAGPKRTPTIHRSDPGMLVKPLRANPVEASPRRTDSAIQGILMQDGLNSRRTSTQQDGTGRPRRASVPSGAWTGLAPRPADSQEKETAQPETGDSRHRRMSSITSLTRLRRKSRSAGNLQGLFDAKDLPIDNDRRVSEDIREWRRSLVEPGTPPLSPPSPVRDASPDHPALQTPPPPLPVAESMIHSPGFGPLMHQVVALQKTETALLENLVSTLELRTDKLQIAVEDLQNTPRMTCAQFNEFKLEDAPKRRSFRDRTSSAAATFHPTCGSPILQKIVPEIHEARSFERTSQYNSIPITPREESNPVTITKNGFTQTSPQAPQPVIVTEHRPLSTATTLDPSRDSTVSTVSNDQYGHLLALLKREQRRRNYLEQTVTALQEEVRNLLPMTPHAHLAPMLKTSTAGYPTPSPEPYVFSSSSPTAGHHESSSVRSDSTGDGLDVVSVKDSDYGYAASEHDVFRTPTEVKAFGFPDRDDGQVWTMKGPEKKVDEYGRALSLGQLTRLKSGVIA